MLLQPTDVMNEAVLTRALDVCKTSVFLGKNAAFLGSLLCSMNFQWTTDIPTAATNGINIWWNPEWFMQMNPDTRKTVLMHELWHVALLHGVRCGSRDPKWWNYACDININNMLEREGYSFVGEEDCWKDQSFGEMASEEIYDIIIQNKPPPMGGAWGNPLYGDDDGTDLLEGSPADLQQTVSAVVQAVTTAKMSNQAGSIPGDIEQVIKTFLAPIIPWQSVFYKWFNDMFDTDYEWTCRDRRFPNIYLPGEVYTDGKLDHLLYIEDVSGSVTDAQSVRFNSEVKYIKETFNPKKLTLALFDTRITSIKVFLEDDPFDEIVIIGRGGTNLEPVRQLIEKEQPTAVVIFSDLLCAPMRPLKKPIPIVWVVISNKNAKIPFGDQIIYIEG